MNEAQHNNVYGWIAITTIYDPVILLVEFGHIADCGPGAGIIPAMPDAIYLDLG
jgi:hypothetical protein